MLKCSHFRFQCLCSKISISEREGMVLSVQSEALFTHDAVNSPSPIKKMCVCVCVYWALTACINQK